MCVCPVPSFPWSFRNTKENLKNTKDFPHLPNPWNPGEEAENTQKDQGNSQQGKHQGNKNTKEKKERVCNWKFNSQTIDVCSWRVHRKYLHKRPNYTKRIPARKSCVTDVLCIGNQFPNNKNVCVIILGPIVTLSPHWLYPHLQQPNLFERGSFGNPSTFDLSVGERRFKGPMSWRPYHWGRNHDIL